MERRFACERQRRFQIGAHTPQSGAGGIGLACQIDEFRLRQIDRLHIVRHDLHGAVLGLDEARMDEIRLGEPETHRGVEAADVESAVHLDILRDDIGVRRDGELIRHPYAGLRRDERKRLRSHDRRLWNDIYEHDLVLRKSNGRKNACAEGASTRAGLGAGSHVCPAIVHISHAFLARSRAEDPPPSLRIGGEHRPEAVLSSRIGENDEGQSLVVEWIDLRVIHGCRPLR